MLFEFLAYLTGLTVLVLVVVAWVMYRDSFHPLIYIGPMLVFLYSFLPLYLSFTQREVLRGYLAEGDLVYVQVLNGLGAAMLCLGILLGSGPAAGGRPLRPSLPSDHARHRLARAAALLGLIGLAAYAYMLASSGGFSGAYGRAYGGVWADSGYVRELQYLTVAALVLLLAARTGRRLSPIDWGWILLFAAPWLIHGLLGGRRGPTFMILVAFGAGWYFMRARRPRLTTTTLGGLSLGLLLLFLVAHRDQIYLSSNFELNRGVNASYAFEVHSGNEFVYGAGAILNVDFTREYRWGRRYATVLFVRPIPRALWPSKYDDAAAALGTPSIETRGGVGDDFQEAVGWTRVGGAAPGIVADIWIEFWWAAFLVILSIGWCYGRAWSRAATHGGIWVTLYVLMFSLSIFMVMQSLQAMLFRLLLLAVPALLAWWYAGRLGAVIEAPGHRRFALSGGPR